MNVGICWAVKDPSDASFKSGKRRLHISAAFEGPFEMGQHLTRRCDVCGLQMRPSKDAAAELGHGQCLFGMIISVNDWGVSGIMSDEVSINRNEWTTRRRSRRTVASAKYHGHLRNN